VNDWDAQPLSKFLRDPRLGDAERFVESRHNSPGKWFFSDADRPAFQTYWAAWDVADPGATTEGSDGAAGQGSAAELGTAVGAFSAMAEADDLCRGRFRFFSARTVELGTPPDWHRHPLTGERYPEHRHWSEIGEFSGGDIKLAWEPCRFAWAYALVRAYWRTGDETYPELFWQLFEDWRTHNPPQCGVHWKCGQEVALRVMACCFALHGLAGSSCTTPARTASLVQMLAVSGERIAANIRYALSQQNNHGISEATGLWTLGLLFPEFVRARPWRDLGREALETQLRTLVDQDGVFSQHSVNYQRVMLQASVWSIRLGEVHGQPLSAGLRERVRRAGEFLWQMQDSVSGRLPRYGAQDGALVLPLTNCSHADYRPAVQASAVLTEGERRFASGPWDEEALWLCGPQALETPRVERDREDWSAEDAGYYVLRSAEGLLFTRAGRFQHRPSQADLLHVDLWWRGENVALDPGTFTYNGLPPWDSPLAGTAGHNTVTVDGRDQMERFARFLWLPWARGRKRDQRTSSAGHITCWEGSHDGYERLRAPVSCRRAIVRLPGEYWLVLDHLESAEPHDYRLHWLLPDVPCELSSDGHVTLSLRGGEYGVRVGADRQPDITLVRAEAESPRGWFAPAYACRAPAWSLAAVVRDRAARFWTLFGPGQSTLKEPSGRLLVATGTMEAEVRMHPVERTDRGIIAGVELRGDVSDRMELE
jgi:asparagine synthase (glutamine-hydrolysing)